MLWLLACAGMMASLGAFAETDNAIAGASQCLVCHNVMDQLPDSLHARALATEGHEALPDGDPEARCETCHGPSMEHASRQFGGPWVMPSVSFNENDHAGGNQNCLDCHGPLMSALGQKAQQFHTTAQRNDLSCMRCHGGVAHGLPEWVVDIREQQEAAE